MRWPLTSPCGPHGLAKEACCIAVAPPDTSPAQYAHQTRDGPGFGQPAVFIVMHSWCATAGRSLFVPCLMPNGKWRQNDSHPLRQTSARQGGSPVSVEEIRRYPRSGMAPAGDCSCGVFWYEAEKKSRIYYVAPQHDCPCKSACQQPCHCTRWSRIAVTISQKIKNVAIDHVFYVEIPIAEFSPATRLAEPAPSPFPRIPRCRRLRPPGHGRRAAYRRR